MTKQFYFKQLSLALVHRLVLFNPYIGPSQVLPIQARVNLGAMAMKGYSAFPKDLALFSVVHRTLIEEVLSICRDAVCVFCVFRSSNITGNSPSDCFVSYQDTRWVGGHPFAEKLSVYSIAPADWVNACACMYLCMYVEHSISFQTFFVQAFKIVVASWKFRMLLLYSL